MSEPLKILFKYPSRGRVSRFFDGLDSIVNNVAERSHYHISCTLDVDDPTMNNGDVTRRLYNYENLSVQWGKSSSKIDAINRDMPDYPFDILVNHSDDMRFNLFGFDQCIRGDMNTYFPNLDGLLHYPDQDAKEWLATMYIAGRKFYDMFGFVYDPQFKSLWCDNLVMKTAIAMGKYRYTGYQINEHLNPAYGHLEKDEMFLNQQAYWGEDEATYHKIVNAGLDKYILQFLNKQS